MSLRKLIPSILCFIFFSASCYSQEFAYKKYTAAEGLAGNQVYHSAKDSLGFLWFATETGVSRFDGSRFKNFTTAEGLPDNEILKLFVDSRGRVWMLPYKNEVCFYENGVVYNAGNDKNLHQLRFIDYVQSMIEDKDRNLFFIERKRIVVLRPNGQVLITSTIPNGFAFVGGGVNDKGEAILRTDSAFNALTVTHNGELQFQRKELGLQFWPRNSGYFFLDEKAVVCLANYNNMFEDSKLIVADLRSNRRDSIELLPPNNNITAIGDSLFLNGEKGSWLFNLATSKLVEPFLPGENLTSTVRDTEGNIWFSSLGHGIFRLASGETKNVFFGQDKLKWPVYSLFATATDVIVGSDDNRIFRYNKKTSAITQKKIGQEPAKNNIGKIIRFAGNLYMLSDGALYRTDTLLQRIGEIRETSMIWSYKDFEVNRDGTPYFASHVRAFSLPGQSISALLYSDPETDIEVNELQKRMIGTEKSILLEGRSTAISLSDSGVYLGTIAGLKFVDDKRKVKNVGAVVPELNRRITRLLNAYGKLWVGTNDAGLFYYDGSKTVAQLGLEQGMTSNLVRCVFSDGRFLWVGTDRGLNKIDVNSYRVVQTYTSSEGLTSDVVNAVFVQGDTVYAGTSEGMSIFSAPAVSSASRCDLRILGITVSGNRIPVTQLNSLNLSNTDNNIRFDFVAISYKSEGNITYHFKLAGIDTSWNTTRENFLQYPTLPAGDYVMALYAVNKYGVKSHTQNIRFRIEKKLIEKPWFLAMLIITGISLAWMVAYARVRSVRRVQRSNSLVQQRISHLEQQALKSQMNPHFIFNCLNSIQQYVIDKDVQGANRFIAGFSKLIRQTLDNSGRQTISVGEEESFLRSYLELEKSRFEGKFDYSIFIHDHVDREIDILPPMLLQPYVENCIRHGIMHKQNGKGFINIAFTTSGDRLVCEILDNGIGREAGTAFKKQEHGHYQSRGTDITSQRIQMMNKNRENPIQVQIDDLTDDSGSPAGTKVTISIPLNGSE